MKKVLKTAVLVFMTVVLSVVVTPSARQYYDPQTTVRIGLYYGSDALSSANLENSVGSGYSFGYFDSQLNFIPVGYTSEIKISMMKDWNMYLSGGKYYDEKPNSSNETIGCYHVLLDQVFESFEDAATEAATYTRTRAFPAYYSGQYRVSVGSYNSYSAADEARQEREIPGSVFTASSKCITVVATGTADILFEFDCGDSASLAVMPNAAEGEKALTWFKGYKYYGAFQYTRLTGDDITVVNILDIEDYIKGVVPYEMSSSWPIEALKAQALCARTYTASHMNNHKSYGFDLCATTCCQAYGGTNRSGENSDRAVDETAGEYIVYNQSLCETYYFSSDGGATESSENVWNTAIPYLRGVLDPYEKYVSTGFESWSYTYTNEDITYILKNKGYNCSTIVSVTPTYTDMGNIYSLKFTDSNGRNWTFSRSSAGSILHSPSLGKYTRSQRFTIADYDSADSLSQVYVNGGGTLADASEVYAIGADGTISKISGSSVNVITGDGSETIEFGNSGATLSSGKYIVSGSGWGHNVGMSQYGAKAMAELGFTYKDIITFYFTGVNIE